MQTLPSSSRATAGSACHRPTRPQEATAEPSLGRAPRMFHLCNSLEMGGAEALAVQMVNDQAARYPCLPALITLRPCADTLLRRRVDHRVTVQDLGMHRGVSWTAVAALRRVIGRTGTQVIHAHNPGPLLVAAAAGIGTRVRIVYTHHGSGVIPRFGQQPLLRAWLLHRCQHFVGVSPEATACLQQSFQNRIAARKVRTILNGVRIEPRPARPGGTATCWADDGTPVIGYVGRLAREKRVDLIIQAMAQLSAWGIAARLVVVGDGALRTGLEEQSAALHRAGRVVFLGNRPDVAELLPRFHLFVNSSDTEGISLGILEAMAAALPIVATAVGGTPLLLEEGISGRLIPPGSPDALAAVLRALLVDPQQRKQLGRAAQARARTRFSFRAMMDRYEELYQG